MEFFQSIRKSIYDPEHYRELPKKPFSYSLKYFISFILFLALCGTVLLSLTAVPAVNVFLKGIGPQVLQHYPDNLEITIQDGRASTNVPEPYAITFPAQLRNEKNAGLDDLIVIETKHPLSVESLRNAKTASLLAADSIAFQDKDGVIRVYPLSRVPNMKITKALVSSWIDKLTPLVAFAGPIVVLGIFGFFLFYLSFPFSYLLFGALLIMLVSKIKRLGLGYKKAYQLGLHLVSLGLTVNIVSIVTGYHRPVFLFTMLLIVLAWVNLGKKPETFGA